MGRALNGYAERSTSRESSRATSKVGTLQSCRKTFWTHEGGNGGSEGRAGAILRSKSKLGWDPTEKGLEVQFLDAKHMECFIGHDGGMLNR